jgi:hypothetical protein
LPYHSVAGSLDGSGSILLARSHEVLFRENASETEEEFVSNGFYGENARFLECVEKGIRPTDDIASGLQAVEIADCIRQRFHVFHAGK